jgi:tetratricopeptide (TPR) repeat protein
MAAQGGMPGMGGAQPTPEQLKTMAEKKIAPLFEDLKKNPKDTDTLTKIGTYYMAAGQFEDAEKYFKQVVDIKPSADAWTKLSNAQAYAGSGEKAIASLNSALLLDPKFANALFNLGLLKWQVQNDPKGAIACWETLIRTNPDHPKLDQVKELIAHAKEQMKAPKAKPVKQ